MSAVVLRQAVDEFLHAVELDREPATYRRYRSVLDGLLVRFGEQTPVKKLTVTLVDRWKTERRTAGTAPGTVRTDLQAVSGLCSFAIRRGWLRQNPVSGVELPPGSDEGATRVLNAAEELLYFGALSRRRESGPGRDLHDAAVLLREQGMRPEELLGGRWSDILAGTHLFIAAGKTKYARRKLELTVRSRAVLDSRADIAARSPFFFPSPRPGLPRPLSYSALQKQHQRLVEKIGLADVSLYALRHTFATTMAEAGCPLPVLGQLLGHSPKNGLKMVLRYVHPSQAAMDQAMQTFAARA